MAKNGTVKLKDGRLDLVGVFEAHEIIGVERSRLARWLAPFRDSVRVVQKQLGLEEDGRLSYETIHAIQEAGLKPEFAAPSGGLPLPRADMKSGPVWLRDDIATFAEQRRERTTANA